MQTVHQSPFFVIFIVLHLQQVQIQDTRHASGLALGSSIHSRPRPSQDITSLIHIQEIPGSKYDPRSINNAKLKLKLGRNFDPEFMSIYPPEDLNTTKTVVPETRKPNLKKLRQKSRHGHTHSKYTHDNDVVMGSGTMLDYGAVAEQFHGRLRFKFIRKLEKFLQVYTSCPLQYKWRDLGVRFWPRYLREGHCQGQQYNDAHTISGGGGTISSTDRPTPRSCSIPPGLYCQPSAQVYKVLLRWHCQNWEHRKRCRWLEIRHPVITACSCGTCGMTGS